MGHRGGRRAAAAFVAAILAVALLPLTATSSQAVVITPLVSHQDLTVNGDVIGVGNASLGCTSAPGHFPGGGGQTCASLYAGAGASNNNLYMSNVDVDSDPSTYNSSSASLAIPAGSTVAAAWLYWGVHLNTNKNGDVGFCDSGTSATGFQSMPAGGPTSPPLLKIGGGAYTAIAPGHASTGTTMYMAATDVSSQLGALSSGSNQTITVANVPTAQGYGCWAGWALDVAYDFGTFSSANPQSLPHEVDFFDGQVEQQTTSSATTVTVNGFKTIAPGARAVIVGYEGDRALAGDSASWYANGATGSAVPLTSAFGESNNFFTSVANGAQPFPGAGSAAPWVDGSVDVAQRDLATATGTTSVSIALATSSDGYYLQSVALSVPVAAIGIDKSFDGTADQQTVVAGGTAHFTIIVTNRGSAPLTNVTVADAKTPACAITSPFSLAVGASRTFTCTATNVTQGFTNTATASGSAPNGDVVSNADASTVDVPGITVAKSVSSPVVVRGSSATWTVVVTNSGSIALDHVSLSDPAVPGCNRSDLGSLAAGTSAVLTCTAPVPAGFTNSASATGTATGGGPQVTGTDTATVAVSGISLVKTADLDAATPGQAVTFHFVITNTGEVPLTNPSIADPAYPSCDQTLTGTTLAPAGSRGASTSVDCTVTAGLTDIANTATATGTPPAGPAPVDSSSATVRVLIPGLQVTKTAASSIIGSGDTATFTVTVVNTGEVDLRSVVVDDRVAPGCSWTIALLPAAVAGSAPGTDSRTCTVDAVDSPLTNTATATGVPVTGGPAVTGDATATVGVRAIQITKSTTTPVVLDGDTATFHIVVTNSGSVALSDVVVTDPLTSSCARTIDALAVGASVGYDCTATVSSGFTNTATVTGDDGSGGTVTDSDSAKVSVAGLDITKTADTPVVEIGGTATYTITVHNTGEVDLAPVTVTDAAAADCGRTLDALAAGASRSYQCTVDNVQHGFTNEVDATGAPAGGGPVATAHDSAAVRVSGIQLTKSARQPRLTPGATAVFDLTVTNTGEVTLSDVHATDPQFPQCANDFATLSAGDSRTWSCTTTVGTTDITNTATVTGTPPSGPSPSDTASATVDVSVPGLQLSKAAVTPVVSAGGTATFRIIVRNTGLVDLQDVSVTDPIVPDCARDIGDLAAGATAPSYECTVSGVDALLDNVATVNGQPTDGGTAVTDDDEAIVRVASLHVDKSTSTPVVPVGSDATFTVVVTNTGDVPVADVHLDDPSLSGCTQDLGTLAAGAQVQVSCTRSPVGSGFTNTATASGTATLLNGTPTSVAVSDSDSAHVAVSDLTLTKTVDEPTAPVGSHVTFSLVAHNTGEVTLDPVIVSDQSAPDCAWTGSLAAGESHRSTCSVVVPAGGLQNVATAAGTPPSGPSVTPPPADADVLPSDIAVVKTADVTTAVAGQTVTYTVVVTNTGAVALENVTTDDPIAAGCSVTVGHLDAGESSAPIHCPATMPDQDLVNTLTATGTPPAGPAPSAAGSATVDLTTAAIDLRKSTTTPILVSGGTAHFDLTATNTGATTLTHVVIADPMTPGCSATFDTLAPAQQVTTSCDVSGVMAGFTNQATATGQPPGGAAAVNAAATAVVQVESITLTKTAVKSSVTQGQPASFQLTVRNTGEVALVNVHVTDPLSPACARDIALIAVGGSQTWTCASAPLSKPLTNVASVTAAPQGGDGPSVGATASARVVTTKVLGTKIPGGGSGGGGGGSGSGGPGALAFTGAHPREALLAGLALTLLGAGLVVGARRRRRA
jgi:uncharacterized repeat protein (TIGR01451 family)